METIEVTTRFDREGRVTPLGFTWQGVAVRVDSTGRQWRSPDGLHVLCGTPDGRVYELVFQVDTGRWLLAPPSGMRPDLA